MTRELSPEHWRKSQCSASTDCVEVAVDGAGGVFVRDSKEPDGPVLRFDRDTWRAFLADVKEGRFDGAQGQRPSSAEPTVQ